MPVNDTIASEALAAAVGGAISSGALYPLEVLKTRMQSEGEGSDDNTHKKNHRTIDGKNNDSLRSNNSPTNRNAGENREQDEEDGSSSCNSDPGNKSAATHNSLAYARNLYRSEGIGVFFDGVEVSALQSAIEKALYFFAYTALKRGYTYARAASTANRTSTSQSHADANPKQQQLSAMASVLLGCLAEWVHLPITLPIDALTTAIQTSGGSNNKNNTSKTTKDNTDRQKSHTVLALWMILWKEKSFYKGIQAYWILCFKPALQYTIFEQVKAWILKLRSAQRGRVQPNKHEHVRQPAAYRFPASHAPAQLAAAEAFLLGMFSRTVATLVVFPFVRAKVRMQSLSKRNPHPSNSSTSTTSVENTSTSRTRVSSPFDGAAVDLAAPPPQTIWKLLAETYARGGWKALYQGLGPELTRGVLSAALMMMVKERIGGGVKKILYRDDAPMSS
mmetsp:Transcript_9217/g.19980  ORF Transcript_9217/g.19980 Transcript_9217/m.19980 type:complete len:448 (-) Transcript_9217:238-1581(-)